MPRAELWAAAWAKELGGGNGGNGGSQGGLNIRADAAYVVNGAANEASRARLARGRNGDLWSELGTVTEGTAAATTISKVKAHRAPAEMLADPTLSVADFLGNHLADACAGAAAECALRDSPTARMVERWERRAYLVALRLAAVEAWHWEHGAPPLYPRPEPLPPWEPKDVYMARQQLHQQVLEQGHVLRVENGRTVCGRCHKRRACCNAQFWVTNPCRPLCTGRVVPRNDACAAKRPNGGPAASHLGEDNGPPASRRRGGEGAASGATTNLGADTNADTDDHHRCDDGPREHAEGEPTDMFVDAAGSDDDEDVFGFGGSLDQPSDGGPGDDHPREVERPSAQGVTTPARGGDGGTRRPHLDAPPRLGTDGSKRARKDASSSSGGPPTLDAADGGDGSGSGSGGRPPHVPPRAGPAARTDTESGTLIRRRIIGKRPAADAGIVQPSPTALGEAGAREDDQRDDLVTARVRRALILEQRCEARRRRIEDADCLRRAWGDADPAVSAAAFVEMQPTDQPPPFSVDQGHSLVACGGFYGCVRCGAVVGWHGHRRLALPCRGTCPVGSRGPIRLLVHGRLPHRQQEHYGRDWPSGEKTPVPYRVCLSQSRPGAPARAAA